MVWIPEGQNILLDVSTPILNTLIVEGRLIVKDVDLVLQAHHIFVRNGGLLQIGSPEAPLTS